jgi:hypothetical protein
MTLRRWMSGEKFLPPKLSRTKSAPEVFLFRPVGLKLMVHCPPDGNRPGR